MTLDTVEQWMRWIGAAALLVPLGAIFWGLWAGLRRPVGRVTGHPQWMLRAPVYLLGSLIYFGLWIILWRPLPLAFSIPARWETLILGGLLYFSGLGLILWGRLTLGEMYNASSGFGIQLYDRHRLITHGPFAYVRHPMYLGILIAALGGCLMYRTWTLVFVAANFLGLAYRARREEQALAAEFGEQWQAYCRQVPAWIPRLHWRSRDSALGR